MRRRGTQIDKPTSKPITAQERREIEESVLNAVRRVSEPPKVRKRLRQLARGGADAPELFTASCLLDEFEYAPRSPLHNKRVMGVIVGAVARNDVQFFIRLGKVLARKPKKRPRGIGEKELPVPRGLEQFLIGRWASPTDELPELFYLTPDSLAEVCSHFFGKELFPEAIVKVRQRLGLKPFRRGKVRVISVNGKLKFV